jgi:adenylate kinase family enzyme
MRKILIFGNSGSGKSTLAKRLCGEEKLAHLDLDTLAWQPTNPPIRNPLAESEKSIVQFINTHGGWVIEGCYTELLEMAVPQSNEIIFMNLPIEICIANAKNRPWEPHKYESMEAQNKNLEMLIGWVSQYSERSDSFSEAAHQELYKNYTGKKTMVTSNEINT